MFERIKNFFRKAGASVGMVDSLQNITDHPKINIDSSEYNRIQAAFNRFENKWGKVSYINSQGVKKERDYISLNMDKLVAETMTSLVFNEECEINIGNEQSQDKLKNAQDYINHVLEHNDFKKNFSRYLEPMFATGGLVVRPYYDPNTKEIEFSWALANAFYPLRNNTGAISEGAIASVTTKTENDQTVYYTLLEFHEWQDGQYKITNELYRSEMKTSVGVKVPLSTLYEGLQETSVITGLSRPNFSYLKPSGFNNLNPYSPLGLGLCDNSVGTIQQINDAFDQFNWEIKMGQRKVIVSDHFLRNEINELADGSTTNKQVFDDESNVFVGLKMDMDDMSIKDITHDIRTEQYISAINHFFKTLETQTKLSVGTFSFDGKSVKTATEVVSENSATFRTRNNHLTEIEKFIKGLIISILELAQGTITTEGKALYSGEIPDFEDIGIDFDDGVFTDKNALLDYYGKARTFGLIPDVEIIQRVFDVPEEKAREWIQEITNQSLQRNPEWQQTAAEISMLGEEE